MGKGLEIGIDPVFTSGPLVSSDLGYHKNLCGGGGGFNGFALEPGW